ncbi:MAG TPA: Holliday junction resolvase RuvX [Terriglobales bacterium]|nr:Holliday junction resolvase RuvX [Terriglobales bacterium]
MRVLGIDYGDRHVGLALSDTLLVTARPYGTYRLTGREPEDRKFFVGLVAREDVGEIVVGDPLRMDGTTGTRSEKTRLFAAWLGKAVGRPVALVDERLTTREALQFLRTSEVKGRAKKEAEDQVAAVIILSTYLERKRDGRDRA